MGDMSLSGVMCMYGCIGYEEFKYWGWKYTIYTVEHKFR